ncbi:hypothetical protein SARC_04861 [Sphaeroforma arctica JP610]|uniref:Uncharacterized protein n=1 Tax=Sphaeroforma arctica JP610 TaxID=667725 RepID=A0A0L0G204_9EUKA|nr:hypothetical protein SARC_04861 [Sphaeroforma arctica JP610]KNC82861.1 hypothetical protein SARC_04861 [Sphaeroforma arctica JP610]|eukprot:XP_014156763.1 hypothetical protein SARC_04861 [Sphaeroforma arctica JP610]
MYIIRASSRGEGGSTPIGRPLCVFFRNKLNILGIDLPLRSEFLYSVTVGGRVKTTTEQDAKTHLWFMLRGACGSFSAELKHNYTAEPSFGIACVSLLEKCLCGSAELVVFSESPVTNIACPEESIFPGRTGASRSQ